MKTLKQFMEEASASSKNREHFVGRVGIDKSNHFYMYLGLNKNQPLHEVYTGGRFDEFPETDLSIHTLHQIDPHPSIIPFTGNISRPINDALYKEATEHVLPEPHIVNYAHDLDALLGQHIAKKTFAVYTGMHKSPISHSGEWDHERTSKTIHLPNFLSTSTSIHEAHSFTDVDKTTPHLDSDHHGTVYAGSRHIARIVIPEGMHGVLSVRNQSKNPSENEILLARGHSFDIQHRPTEIVEKSLHHRVYVWHLEPYKLKNTPRLLTKT